jgi:hypothetical protein
MDQQIVGGLCMQAIAVRIYRVSDFINCRNISNFHVTGGVLVFKQLQVSRHNCLGFDHHQIHNDSNTGKVLFLT